ncbi:hypothetical protein LWI29_019044 [Acer saccharum]|uniref:Protein kinase domain-containing protein n=1 Tax=Acer saccharum TaxID=4024 RepID=A0AA39RHZ3_ACESA|nr:hypothetical protein LWI29_019044 [Acer saccharum]
MELIYGDELFNKSAKGRRRDPLARLYFQQLIFAVDFYHNRGVYDYDLKPENLLLDKDDNVKVTDFRLSAFFEHLKQDAMMGCCTTLAGRRHTMERNPIRGLVE